MNELIGLSYSPWSEQAKWALDVRKVHPYRLDAFGSGHFHGVEQVAGIREVRGRARAIVANWEVPRDAAIGVTG